MYLYRHPPSGQSRVYQVTQLRTDGVHCQEYAGTGPVVLKVVPVTSAAFSGITHGPINVRLSFPTPTMGMKWVCYVRYDTEMSEAIYKGGFLADIWLC